MPMPPQPPDGPPEPIVSRQQAAEHLAVASTLLFRYEARGLVRAVRRGDVEGYGPAEVRRLGTIVSLQRDLGINLAGVEAVLKLHNHLRMVHRRLDDLARALRSTLDEGGDLESEAGA